MGGAHDAKREALAGEQFQHVSCAAAHMKLSGTVGRSVAMRGPCGGILLVHSQA